MKKIVIILMLLGMALSVAYADNNTLKQTSITVSNRYLNKIECPVGMTALRGYVSSRNNVQVSVYDNSFMIDVLEQEDDLDHYKIYQKSPFSMYLYCSDNGSQREFNVFATPASIPALVYQLIDYATVNNTVVLPIEHNKMFQGLAREDVLSEIAKSVFATKNITGFKKVKHSELKYYVPTNSRNIIDNNNITDDKVIRVIYAYSYDNGGYIVKEFYIYSKREIQLDTTALLNLAWVDKKKVLATALFNNDKFSGWNRAIVIESM